MISAAVFLRPASE